MKVPMTPSVPPTSGVRIDGRRGIHAWCCIDRIFFHHHAGLRDYDRPSNDDCLGTDRSRFLYSDTGRCSVLVDVSFTLVGGSAGIGSYRQIGRRYRGSKSYCLAAPKIALRMYIFPLWSLVLSPYVERRNPPVRFMNASVTCKR
jgi:hypothetical protein